MTEFRSWPLVALAVVLHAAPIPADTLVAARMIRAQQVLTPEDVALRAGDVPGALGELGQAVGLEARANLYAGRPIRPGDVGPPALVERNQQVVLNYHHAGLAITTEGRALGRGGVGEQIRVMNLASRTTVTGTVLVDGSITVGPAGP